MGEQVALLILVFGQHTHMIRVLSQRQKLVRKQQLGVVVLGEHLQQDGREPVLLQVKPERVRRVVLQNRHVPLGNQTLLQVSALPNGHFHAYFKHRIGHP